MHIEREYRSELVLEDSSSRTFAKNLEMDITSLELIILAKTNVHFISNCFGRKQMYKGSILF